MIVDKVLNVESNITSARSFKISDNSIHLFRMLSDFLYSNKEMCVLHELSANAVDEHKRFGIPDTPIEIIAPTTLEPKLIIRDFGEGLSEEMVYKLLTTYGESGEHKRVSNDFFGAWGIGSKSVAAVTKTWEVKSYHHGVVSFYLIFINEKGVPSITKTFSDKTDRSGLEIIIPVASNNFNRWTSLFSEVYRYYNVKPSIKNFTVNYPNIKSKVSGTGWARDTNSGSTTAITNYRAYNLDLSKLKSEIKDDRALSALSLAGFRVYMNTGELELSLSREVLQYSKHSVASLEKKFITVWEEFSKQFLDSLGTPTNSLEYRVALKQSINKYLQDSYSYTAKAVVNKIIKDNKYGVTMDSLYQYILPGVKNDIHKPKVGRRGNVKHVTSSFTAWKTYAISYDIVAKDLKIKIDHMSSLKIVVADIRDTDSRVRHYTTVNAGQMVLILPPTYKLPAELKNWIIKASSLEKPVKVRGPRTKREKVESTVYGLARNSFFKMDVEANDLKSRKCVYIKFKDARTQDSIVAGQVPHFSSARDLFSDLGYTIVGIKEDETPPSWVRSIKDEAEILIKATNPIDVEMSYQYKNIHKGLKGIFQKVSNFPKDSVIESAYKIYKNVVAFEITKGYSDYNWERLHNVCDKTAPKVTGKTLNDYAKEIFDKYPMLKYNDSYYSGISKSDIEQYINLVEGVK